MREIRGRNCRWCYGDCRHGGRAYLREGEEGVISNRQSKTEDKLEGKIETNQGGEGGKLRRGWVGEVGRGKEATARSSSEGEGGEGVMGGYKYCVIYDALMRLKMDEKAKSREKADLLS